MGLSLPALWRQVGCVNGTALPMHLISTGGLSGLPAGGDRAGQDPGSPSLGACFQRLPVLLAALHVMVDGTREKVAD